MDGPHTSSQTKIKLGEPTWISQIGELNDTCISTSVTINGVQRTIMVIMSTQEYNKLHSQGKEALSTTIQAIIEHKLKPYLAQTPNKTPEVKLIELDRSFIAEVDSEFAKIQEALDSLHQQKMILATNHSRVKEEMHKQSKKFKPVDFEALENQTKSQVAAVNKKTEKLLEDRSALVNYRVSLLKEIHALSSKLHTGEKHPHVKSNFLQTTHRFKFDPSPLLQENVPEETFKGYLKVFFQKWESLGVSLPLLHCEKDADKFINLTPDQKNEDITKLYDYLSKKKNTSLLSALEVLCRANKIDVVKIERGTEPSWIPKFLFTQQSPMFADMLRNTMLEVNKGLVSFNVPQLETFVSAIIARDARFLLSGENVLELLAAAETYDIMWLKEECKQFLREHIDGENVQAIFAFATQYKYPDIISNCIVFTFNNQKRIEPIELEKLRKGFKELGITEWDILEKFSELSPIYNPVKGVIRLDIQANKFFVHVLRLKEVGTKNNSAYQPSIDLHVIPFETRNISKENLTAALAANHTIKILHLDLNSDSIGLLSALNASPVNVALSVKCTDMAALNACNALSRLIGNNALRAIRVISPSINDNLLLSLKSGVLEEVSVSIGNRSLPKLEGGSLDKYLTAKSKIRVLNLSNLCMFDKIGMVANYTQLEELSVRLIVADKQNLDELRRLIESNKDLRVLNLSNSTMTEGMFNRLLDILGDNKSIRSFSIRGCISDGAPLQVDITRLKKLLRENSTLETFDLSQVTFKNGDCTALLESGVNLKGLFLSDSMLNSQVYARLCENTTLKFLDITSSRPLPAEFYTFVEENESLETLVVDAAHVDVGRLARMLMKNISLKTVLLKNLSQQQQLELRNLIADEPQLTEVLVAEPAFHESPSRRYVEAIDAIKDKTHQLHHVGDF